MGWYLYPYRRQITSINFLADNPFTLDDVSRDPDIDPQALANAAEFSDKIRFRDEIPKTELTGEGRSFVFAWKALSKTEQTALADLGWRTIVNVDKTQFRSEGSNFLGISLRGFSDNAAAIEHSRRAFDRLGKEAIGDHVYIFGTGPSLATLEEYDFSDGKAIAINSMVKNLDLLDRLDLLAITAADPIFHAGCSIYAAEFRRHLLTALDRYRCFLLVPLRDFDVYRSFLPERHHEHLIGVPFDAGGPYNIDLRRNFCVNPKPNVLTLLLFPVAATFYKHIYVAGCDGRPLSESRYFWDHDPKSQFNDELAAIKRVHPGFFNLDYNDYYEEHVKTVAQAVAQFEAVGGRIESLTPSFIPAFGDRYRGLMHPRIVSLNPDAVSRFGHYAGYERHLESAVKQRGLSYELFGSREAEPAIRASFAAFKPVFSGRSWSIRCKPASPSPLEIRAFRKELKAALADLRRTWSGDIVFFMYCGSLTAAKVVAEVLATDERAVACIVLFYLSRIDFGEPEYRDRWASDLAGLLAEGKVALVAPTGELADEFQAVFGYRLPVLPHPSTTFGDDHPIFDRPPPITSQRRRTVLFPSNGGDGKGTELQEACLRALCADPRGDLRIRVRYPRAESAVPMDTAFLESLSGRVEFIRGELSAAEFQRMLAEADVVVLAYDAAEFRNRTSGLLIDALYCGVPTVVLRGTWLGNIVEKFGSGVAVSGTDGTSLYEGIKTVLASYEEFHDKALAAREQVRGSHSWKRLVDVIVAASNASHLKRVPPPARTPISLAVSGVAGWIRAMIGGLVGRLHGRRIAASSLALLTLVLAVSAWATFSQSAPKVLTILLAANLLLTAWVAVLISVFLMRRFDRLKREAEAQTREVVRYQLYDVERRLIAEIRDIRQWVERETPPPPQGEETRDKGGRVGD